jgi:NADPH:quinone reductase
MRAIRCLDFGHPPELKLQSVARPRLSPGGVRVRVEYCGLGFPEGLMLQGKYQMKLKPPFVPGSEIAGTVIEIAEGVEYPRVGSRVVGLDQSFCGGLAEEIVTDADQLLELPDFVTTRVAAGMAVNYATACYGLVQRGGLQVGETALVLGAGGNLGGAFVEMIDALGGVPLAACGSSRKLEVAAAHGATMGFDYTKEPIKEAVERMTGGEGLDLVVDPVGGDYSQAALRCLRPGGRLLVTGFAAGEIACMPLNLPLLKNCSVVGVLLSTQVVRNPAEFRENLSAAFELYREGLVRPELIEVDCFSDFRCGIGLLSERDRIGKVVMRIGGAD